MKFKKSIKNNFLPGIILILLLTSISSVWSQGKVQTIGRYLCIDYKPFFPIGLYHLPDRRNDDAIWKEVADAGFNYLLSGESGRHGIYVSKPIPWKEVDGQRFNLMELYRDESFLEELKAFLEENENDTTMLCWHAPDEPSWFGPTSNVLRLGYQAIKHMNFLRPVMSCRKMSIPSPMESESRDRDTISTPILWVSILKDWLRWAR
jgi:hypothetical protein